MLYRKRQNWDSVDVSRNLDTKRDKKRNKQRKFSSVIRQLDAKHILLNCSQRKS